MSRSVYDALVKKILPVLIILTFFVASCAAASLADFRQQDPEGNTACIHFGGGLEAGGDQGLTNLAKAAEHGAAAQTEQIRQAVSTDDAGVLQIPDHQAFHKACEAQGFRFK